jgi:hypothetical protein
MNARNHRSGRSDFNRYIGSQNEKPPTEQRKADPESPAGSSTVENADDCGEQRQQDKREDQAFPECSRVGQRSQPDRDRHHASQKRSD